MADQDNSFDATPDNATLLIAAALEIGLDKRVVKVRDGKLVAPDDVVEAAGSKLTGETTKKTPTKKAPAKKAAATKGSDADGADDSKES